MASINEKLNYINETKSLIKDKLNDLGSEIEDETTFRDYVDKIEDLYEEWPKISDEDTTISLDNTKKGKMNMQLKGNINQFTTTGKQLFNKNDSHVDIGVEVTTVNTGIRLTLTAASNYRNAVFTIGKSELLGKSFSINRIITPSASNNGLIYVYYGNETNHVIERISSTTTDNIQTFTIGNSFPTDADRINLIFYGNYNGACNIGDYIDYTNLMLVEGSYTSSTIPSYEPYTGGIVSPNPQYPQDVEVVTGENTITISNEDNTESQTFTIDLGNLELCKIDTYQDYFYKENNKWYKYSNIDKIILNGSENWRIQSTWSAVGDKTNAFYMTKPTEISSNKPCYCKFLKHVATNTITSTDEYGIAYATSLIIRMSKTITNTDALSTYLENNNILIYYCSNTPTTTEITNISLITQLNALEQAMSYNNQTNISQENDNLPFIINATALIKNSD